MDLRHYFLQGLQQWGAKPTILEGGEGFSLNQLAAQTAALTDLLRTDESSSKAIPILMPNTRAFIPAFYGAIFAGRTPVPMNPLLPAKELAQLIQVVDGRMLLTVSPLKPLTEKLRAEAPDVRIVYLDELAAEMVKSDPQAFARQADPRRLEAMLEEPVPDVAVMLFSSGTTGRPKAVMLTHENLIENNRAIRQTFDFGEGDTLYGLLPFFHSYGLCALHLSLWGGPRFVMAPRFQPAEILRSVVEHRITVLLLVPEMYKVLTRNDAVRTTDWSSVRLFMTGGGPSPASLCDAWEKIAGLTLHGGYGLTEYSPVVSIAIPGMYRENSVGKALPGVKIHIVSPSGEDLPVGQEGEIWVTGPSVMKGYYGETEATAQMLDAEGWLHTGDVGYLDEDGFLFVSGRLKDIIIVAGENVLPLEVEDAIATHPAVMESAVVGAPDETRGEVPVAFVVLRPDAKADASELRTHLREHLASHKIPREIHFTEQLPKTALGKVLRRELQKQLQQKEAR